MSITHSSTAVAIPGDLEEILDVAIRREMESAADDLSHVANHPDRAHEESEAIERMERAIRTLRAFSESKGEEVAADAVVHAAEWAHRGCENIISSGDCTTLDEAANVVARARALDELIDRAVAGSA